MGVPTQPTFIEVARMMNKMVPELAKNVKPLKPLIKELVTNKELAKGLIDVGGKSKYLKDLYQIDKGKAGTVLKEVKKFTDALGKGAFKELGGKWAVWGKVLTGFSGIAQAGFTTFLVLAQGEMQGYSIQTENFQNSGIQNAFTRSINNASKLNAQQAQFDKFSRETRANIDKAFANIGSISTNARVAREKANDALYEVRQGRVILDGKVAEARKLGNDALYEARQATGKANAQIQSFVTTVNQQFASFKSATERSTQSTIDSLKSALNNALAKIPVNIPTKADIDSAIAKNQAINDAKFREQAVAINNTIKPLETKAQQINEILTKNGVTTTSTPWTSQRQLQDSLDQQYRKTLEGLDDFWQRKGDQRLTTIMDKFKAQTDLESKAAQGNTKALEQLWQQSLKEQEQFTKRLTKVEDNALQPQKDTDTDRKINAAIAPLQNQVTQLDTKIKEQEKVNLEGNRKLDEILPKLNQIIPTIAGIPLIAGRVVDQLKPQIPTIPQIGTEVGRQLCGSKCIPGFVDNGANKINQNNNSNTDAILKALGAGSDLANLALLPVINAKLGDQITGGIGGKLMKFIQWSRLGQALNILTLAATIHNATMLSRELVTTLGSALGNVLSLIGFKNEEGQALDVNAIVGQGVTDLIRGIVGNENYTELTTAWAKANRIYQSSVNVLNAFQGLTSTVLTALELTAGQVAKIGNALRKAGEVLDSAYGWMNPQPKYNRITQTLENLQNGASTIQMVTQAPLDIVSATTELTTATAELTKAIKEDDKPANKGKQSPEPDELKAKELAAKNASSALELIDIDLDPDD